MCSWGGDGGLSANKYISWKELLVTPHSIFVTAMAWGYVRALLKTEAYGKEWNQ